MGDYKINIAKNLLKDVEEFSSINSQNNSCVHVVALESQKIQIIGYIL